MIKQTRFYLGLMLIVQAVSCFFLVICYLFKDKKNTAWPFTILGILSAVGGAVLVAEKVKERFEEEMILEAMNEICDDYPPHHVIPVDETADETEFNWIKQGRLAEAALFHFRTLTPMIIGEIKRYLRDNNAIRVSRSVRDLAYRALQIREQLTAKAGGEPTVEDILRCMEENGEPHTKEEVVNALEAIVEPVSLYDPVCGDGSPSGDTLYVMDQIRDTDGGEEAWLESIALKEALKHLGEREKRILSMRFYKGKTQMEIAAEIGISQAQVSRLEKGALERIRKQL